MKLFAIIFIGLFAVNCTPSKKDEAVRDLAQASGPVLAPGQKTTKIHGLDVPLHNLEVVPAEEPAAIEDINRIMFGFFKKQYSDQGVTKDPATGLEFKGTRRGVRPRGHGCVAAKVVVPNELKNPVGIF